MGAGSNAEPTRSLARIEQRIEELCQRIDQQPMGEESSLIPDPQASGQAQPSAAVDGSQMDATKVLSSAWRRGSSSHEVEQPQSSDSVTAYSDDASHLAVREKASFELRKCTLYGQSLLPSLSLPGPIDKNLGQTLLDKLGAPNEPSAEVGCSYLGFTMAIPNEFCHGLDKSC
jgi:hypothetical protein